MEMESVFVCSSRILFSAEICAANMAECAGVELVCIRMIGGGGDGGSGTTFSVAATVSHATQNQPRRSRQFYESISVKQHHSAAHTIDFI